MDDPRSCSPEHISVAEGAMTPFSPRATTEFGVTISGTPAQCQVAF
jgi:hypothetical protein